MQSKNWDWVLLCLRWVVAGIFIFAGISKILNPADFARAIDNYRLLPYLIVTIMAIILPWLELFSGIFLIIPKWQKGAAFLLFLMTIMFLIAISSAIARGLDITCGCFSSSISGTKVGYTRLLEDVVLFGVLILINLKLNRISK